MATTFPRFNVYKLDDPRGQVGMPGTHKWAVGVQYVETQGFGFYEAFRTKREALAFIAGQKGVSIPSSGPFIVNLKNGRSLDVWYDRGTRSWVVQLKDSEGNQVGPGFGGEAVYVDSREEAVREVESVVKEDK